MNSSASTVYPESLDTTRDSGGNESSLSNVKSTTIGTVVVRSGPIQMLIALLQSGDLYFIKVVEVQPKLTNLGNNIDEAVGQQREHDELLRKLQNMATPVEEFVQKADKLLNARQSNPQVLDAMGQTLNIVWEDILKLLHDRKHLLDLCANFHEKMGSCRGKMASLEVACKDTMIPIEIEAVQEFLHKFKQLRIDVLTAVMSALKDGNELLARLQELAQSGTLDSRPDHIRIDAMRAINQVQQWLEDLHDRRNMLEAAWLTRKTQLEQCLALAILAKELDELEAALMNQRNAISGAFSLGECEHTSNQYLQEYIGLKQDAVLLRDKGVKITRATEKLVTSGCFAGDEACSRAYSVLSNCTEHLEQVDQKEHWLHQSKDFFGKAEKTLSILERLEIELSTVNVATDSPEAFAMFTKILNDLRGLTEEPLRLGYAILDEVGRTKPETQGVKRVLDEIENRKIYIEKICSASTEQQVRVTQALNDFMEEYNTLLSWLVSIAEAFLQSNKTMGVTLEKSKSFLHLHHKLMQDLERKGEEINMLLTRIKEFLNSLDARQRYDVDTKVESLHKHWIEIKDYVFKRVDLVSIYIEFLEKADKLSEMFNYMERKLKDTPEEEKLTQMEHAWADIKTSYGNLKAIGLRFLNAKVADPYLETKSACSHVEDILSSFGNRQFDITSSWEKWTTNITEKREIQILWEKVMNENIEVLNQATKLDAQIYPVLTSPSNDPRELSAQMNRKLNDVLHDIDRAQNEVLERINTTTNIQTTNAEMMQKIEQVTSNLHLIKNKLDNVKEDYRTLLDQIINFLDNVAAMRQNIERYFEQQKQTTLSGDRANINRNLTDHKTFRENTMDKFRMLNAQCEKLIERIRVLEPLGAREHDADRIISLLEQLRVFFETSYDRKMSDLEKSEKIAKFNEEISEIYSNLNKVGKQLDDIKEQQIENSASAKTTSLAFEYFERTIELLEKRIEEFIKSTETIYETYPDTRVEIVGEVEKLRARWNTFKDQVRSTRLFLNSSCEYFKQLEQINDEYRTLHTFYINTSNRIPYLQNPVEASNLVNDIEKCIGSHEQPQMRRLEDLRIQFRDLPGKDAITSKHYDSNVTLFNSFIKLKSDLNVVHERLKNEERERDKRSREEKERLERLQRELEEKERLRRELEEQERLRRELEEKEKLAKLQRELEEKERLRREFEEQERQRRALEEQERLRREFEEKERLRREFEEKERLRRELEEQERLRVELEEKERLRREFEEKERMRQLEEAERQRRALEEEEQRRTYLAEQDTLRRKIEEQEKLLRAHEEQEIIRKEREEQERRRRQAQEQEHLRKRIEEQESLKKHIEENQRIQQQIEESQRKITQIQTRTEINEILKTEIKYSSPLFIKPLHDITIREGEKITLNCQVTGSPEPAVEWFKDGVSIQNNPDYRTTNLGGYCTLSIDETFTADSARFVCRASNLVGTADTTAVLSVKEQHQHINEGMTAPTVVKYLQDSVAREGSTFIFSCGFSGNPLPTVQWFKDGVCIDDSQYYLITYNNGEATLKFEEVFLEDQATYTCKAFNPAGAVECSGKLIVEPLEPTELPSFVVPLSNAVARVGQKIKLECIVAGVPPPEVFWVHNGKPYVGRAVKYEGDRATLIIPEAFPKDAGVYLVTARNIAGEAYSTCNVSVKGRLPNETSDSEMASDMEPIKPSVQLPLKDVSVFEGKSVRLDCVIVGQPEPEVIWYHNERPVKESPEVQLLFQGDRCSLVLQEAYLEDAGKYKVVAINSAGEASSSCTLSVTSLNASEHATRQQSERLVPVESPPKFEKFLTDVLANEGETVTLECSVIGDSPLSAKWYLSNKEMFETDRIKIECAPGDVFKLIISNVHADDKGVYTVKVSNSSGDAKCFSHLIVKSVNAPDSQQRPIQLEPEEKFVCPTFKELFSDQNARIDDTVKFECIVVGKPTPKIRWYFNDMPVHGKHFLVSTSGDRQVLTVPAACSETVGKIACIAENDIGKATCVANLGLISSDAPAQPSSTIDIQRMTQEHNAESSLVTIKKQMFTSTSTSQVSTVQNGLPHSQVHESMQHVKKDFKQIADHQPEIVESRQYQEFKSSDSSPMTIQQKSIVVLQKGGTETTEHPPPKIMRKQVAPRFMSPLIGKIVDQGADVNLEAIYDGFPSPDIKIQKNGDDLFDTDRIKISKELNKVKISLCNVGVRDAGRYSITVANSAGSSTSTADVVVKKTIFPPVFGHRLQAQVAKRGERVIMDVEVTGTPEPTITWYKDNKPLKEAMVSPHKLKDEGNSHTLIIEKAQTSDSGKFMVKATNAGGEAQSIADFAVLEPTPERLVEVVKTTVYDDMKDFQQETSKPKSTSFHTKSVESSTQSGSHGSSESTIITEHRCTTEATMRMEHKPSFLDLPTLTTKPPTGDHDVKSVSIGTDLKQFKSDTTQTASSSFPPKPVDDTNTAVETTSITKQSAFEFFKNIQCESPQTATTEEKYTRFEDARKSTTPTSQLPQFKPPVVHEKPSPVQVDLGKIDLTPGAPPQFGYIQSPQPIRTGESLTERIKKLGESQKLNADVPSGGIKTLPIISKQEEHSMYSKESTYEYSTTPIYRPQAALATPAMSVDRAQSPKPSAEGVAMEKLWASPKPFEHDRLTQERDQDSQGRKQFSCTESDGEYQLMDETLRSSSIKETKQIFEDKIRRASINEELKAPALVKQFCPPPLHPEAPKPGPEIISDIQLEPGSPPEICYAPKPVLERKQSLVETIEQKLEKDIEKEPTYVPPHSVRIIPPPKRDTAPPLPPKDFDIPPPTVTEKRFEEVKFQSEIHRVSKPPPPTVPPKLYKSDYYESDYESDKWKMSESESDEPTFRSVKPPQFTAHPPTAVTLMPKPFVSGTQLQPKPVSGYMADTEDSVFRQSEYRQQSTSSVQTSKKIYESYQEDTESSPTKLYRHHHLARSSHPDETVQNYPQDYSASSFTKNISMTTKNFKEIRKDEPELEPFPFKPDPPRPRPVKAPPPPSPSKFIKGEFRESDYGSDYEEKIPPVWKPYDSDSSEHKVYRAIRPVLTPSGRSTAMSANGESPIPPTQFDNPPKFDGPPRPKFEPIKHEESVPVQSQSHVFKPKPVQGKVPTQQQPSPQKRPNYTTQYYTAIAGSPLHNASMATETSKTVQMRETSETCNRVVNMSQTHRVIHFDNKKSTSMEPQLEPFPYTASPTFMSSPKPRVHLPTPTKFIPGEFRDSDYENEIDGVRIRPVWTPNPSDSEEPHYRRVNPPRPSRSSSLPRTYERVMTPMEFDRHPPEMPSKSPIDSRTLGYSTNKSWQSNSLQRHSTQRTYNTQTTRDDMNLKVGSPPKQHYMNQVNQQMNDFGSTLRSKSGKFMEGVSKDLKTTTSSPSMRPGFKRAPSEGDNKPHAYREESRVSQYGTKHIDPNTGLVYFKYDFGYEFGIIFPGEGKKIIGGVRDQALSDSYAGKTPPSFRQTPTFGSRPGGDIIIPVQHERSSSRQNGFTSESEFSEPEYDGHARKRFSLPLDINIDRLHSADSNNFISKQPTVAGGDSSVPVNAHLNRENRPKRPPIFITPLKDIAVVMGQTARFECIVQSEPHPNITWAKNGAPIPPSQKHVIEFRNGVCRLTIPEAYPDDAATYSCQGANELGSATTSADLIVPGNKCGVRY